MTMIKEIVGDLLVTHNCVIIPGFGGFIAKTESASIDRVKGVMTPPRKSLLFNRQLINNDGLLVNEVSRREAKSYAESLITVDATVSDWKKQLSSGLPVEIDRVGKLYLDNAGHVAFEQDRYFNLLMASYGMGSVQFVPESQLSIVEKEEVEEKSLSKTPIVPILEEVEINETDRDVQVMSAQSKPVVAIEPEVKKTRKLARYIAAACILPIAFYTFWIPVKTDFLESGVISLRDFNPFKERVEAKYTASENPIVVETFEQESALNETLESIPEDVAVGSFKLSESKYLLVDLSEDLEQQQIDVNEDAPEQVFEPQPMNYIVGCFSQKSNADNLVQTLKEQGFDAYEVDFHNGLHRISAGGAMSEESLNSIVSKAKASGYQGWILK
jgi:hypothetical protein